MWRNVKEKTNINNINMRISFLQAGNGDCIYIKSGAHHVIIDSGEVCDELVTLIDSIQKAGEKIDLLVITHYDSDHIKAIINILESLNAADRKKLVKKVWFNATKVGYHGNEQKLSASDATEFSRLLLEADIRWVSELKTGDIEKIDEGLSLEVIDGGEIFQLSEDGKLLGNEKKDWDTSFNELEQYLDDDVLDESKTNSQSAILVLHANGKDVLLPGDAIPQMLSKALDEYRKDKTLKFDLVKLPHHGSYKNITKEVLEKFVCSNYIVTTNGMKYYHPDKKMMLKVLSWGKREANKQMTFHMNYYDDLYKRLKITEAEKHQYDFECDGKRTFEF